MSKSMIKPIYSINVSGATITNDFLDVDFEVIMDSSFEPDLFKLKIYNVDNKTQAFLKKDSIVNIDIGYKGVKGNLITGKTTRIYNENSQSETAIVLEGIDIVIFNLKSKIINLSINNKRDVINIIKDICNLSSVILEPKTSLSGIVLDTYSIENESAYDVIKKLVNRIGYNVTAKKSRLLVTPTISTGIVAGALTDLSGFNLTKTGGISQDNNVKVQGYSFYGAGIPTFTPMKIVNISMTDKKIFGNYLLETITHKYISQQGYTCRGTLISPNAEKSAAIVLQNSTSKTIAGLISEKIVKELSKTHNLEAIDIEEYFSIDQNITAKIGINNVKNKNSVKQSIESTIGENNVFLIKKPKSSIFAGDGFGLITPVYQDSRGIVGFNKSDFQDASLLGFLWKINDVIPDHDQGDYMLHHKNHSKYVMKEDGAEIKQIKSLKIEVGNNGLTISKPTATNDGELLIQFDDGSKLEYNGSKWIINTTGDIEIGSNASSVKLAGGGKSLSHGSHTHNLTALHTHQVITLGAPTGLPIGQDSANASSDNTNKTEGD